MILGSESCKSTATLPLLHHITSYLDWFSRRINQPVSTGKLQQPPQAVPFGWTDRTLSSPSLLPRAPFANSASTLQYPLLHYLIILHLFEPTSLLRSRTYLGGISTSLFTFMFHGLSGTVSIDRALSRRLNIIHHTSISVSVLDLLVLR